jgi:isopenicillin-N N-acyltransferase-like protein
MTRATRYPEVTVAGSPQQMGEQIGEALREEIRGFDDIALERVRKTMNVSLEAALIVARRCIDDVRGYAPHMLVELDGMAHASGVGIERLMLLQIRNQLQPDAGGGCTSFAVGGVAGGSVTGQNWDNDSALDPFSVVLTRRPEDAPAFLSITQAGLIAYLGVNDAGLGLCMNTLPAPARPFGVPHYFTVRGVYEARSLDGAVQAIRRAQRAIPANLMLATPEGPADLEVTVNDVHVLRESDAGPGVVTHTNHCVHPDLVQINDSFPELIESGPRKCRIDELLAAAPRPIPRATLEAILRDHQDHPRSICRHPNDHPTTGFWSSVWSLLIDAEECRLHLSRGNPCEQPYETYSLN